jgi:capsular polysaccharide biosynthesis protein
MSPSDWIMLQQDIISLFQPFAMWCLVGFMVIGISLAVILAFTRYLDTRLTD